MKRFLLLGVVWLCVAPCPSYAQEVEPEAHYQALLSAAKSGSGPIDWQALRYAYAERPSFTGDFPRTDRGEMFAAANAHNQAAVLKAANRVLADNYVDGMAHFFAGAANLALGHPEDGERERAMAEAIFASIKTGDGLSFEHAFTVIAIDEEYDILTTLDLDPGIQSLNHKDGHVFDVFETKDADGKPVTYYFNIDREWAAETRPFKNIKQE